jgi:hypothetical protein
MEGEEEIGYATCIVFPSRIDGKWKEKLQGRRWK